MSDKKLCVCGKMVSVKRMRRHKKKCPGPRGFELARRQLIRDAAQASGVRIRRVKR